MQMVAPAARQLYIENPLMDSDSQTARFDEYDIQTYGKIKREGQNTSAASFGVGFNITITARRIGMKVSVTWEDRRFNKSKKVGGDLLSLSHFGPMRAELDLTHRLTFGTSTTYTNLDGDTVSIVVGDGLALFSATHTLKFSSSTYSNRLTGDPLFSKGSLEAAELLTTTDIISNFGEQRELNFNVIWSGNNPTTVNAIKRFLRSTSDDTQANAGVSNVNQDKYKHVILPKLASTAAGLNDSTKKNWWGIASIASGAVGARWQSYYAMWETSHLVSPDEGNTKNGDADIWDFHTRMTDGIAILSGRGIIASCPVS
jgi:hypothetical protein